MVCNPPLFIQCLFYPVFTPLQLFITGSVSFSSASVSVSFWFLWQNTCNDWVTRKIGLSWLIVSEVPLTGGVTVHCGRKCVIKYRCSLYSSLEVKREREEENRFLISALRAFSWWPIPFFCWCFYYQHCEMVNESVTPMMETIVSSPKGCYGSFNKSTYFFSTTHMVVSYDHMVYVL